VVIDLLSSSDEEKEDAKENKRKLTGKHPRRTGKCMCFLLESFAKTFDGRAIIFAIRKRRASKKKFCILLANV